MMPTNCIPVKFFPFFFKILKVICGNWTLAAFPYNHCCLELLFYKDIFIFFATENRQLLGELNGIDTLLQCLSVSLFNYAIEDFFHVYFASSKHMGSWKNSRQLCNTQDADEGFHKINVENSSSSPRNIFWEKICHQRKKLPSCFLKGYFCNFWLSKGQLEFSVGKLFVAKFVEGNFQRTISGSIVIFSKIFGHSNFQIGYQN